MVDVDPIPLLWVPEWIRMTGTKYGLRIAQCGALHGRIDG
jgi:hypothetical protein